MTLQDNEPDGMRFFEQAHMRQHNLQVPDSLLSDVLTRLGLENSLSREPIDRRLAALNSAKWREQAQAVRALGALGKHAPLERIVASLHDDHMAVRIAALETLGKLGKHVPVPVEQIIEALKDPDGEVRTTVVRVLGEVGEQAPIEPLIASLKDDHEDVRVAAIRALGTLGKQVPVDQLIEALHDPAWQAREAAVFTLGKSTPVEFLVHALEDKEKFVREAAVFVLGDQALTDILDRIVEDLKYGETLVREAATRALGELGERAPIEPLIDALKEDKQTSVRMAAVLALGQLGQRVPFESLSIALQDSDQEVREAAMLVIEAIYPDALSGLDANVVKGSPQWLDMQALLQHTSYAGQQFGEYRLLRPLGSGSLDTVYLGEHIHLKTKVAVKVFQVHLSDENQQNFLTQARALGQLKHPHIVRVLDFGLKKGVPFLVMDYTPHRTLRQQYPKGRQLPLPLVVSYVKQATEGLQYAHDVQLIHGNIKPENMLLDAHDNILLSNFALPVVDQIAHEQYQHVLGTLLYIAPEQLRGKALPASDQYALAVVAYEWLSGRQSFSGPLISLVTQQLEGSPPPFREKVPQNVETVILRALSKEPQQRFASVRAFADALEQASLSEQSHPMILPANPSQLSIAVVNEIAPGRQSGMVSPRQEVQIVRKRGALLSRIWSSVIKILTRFYRHC